MKIDRQTATKYLFKIYPTGANGPPDSDRYKKPVKLNIFARRAGARCTIFPKLCMVIELVEIIKKVSSVFWSNAYCFPTGCTEKFGLIYRRAVSQE